MAAGKPFEAARALSDGPEEAYKELMEPAGINHADMYMLKPVMAALKVLAAALLQTGTPMKMLYGALMGADVEETEAILSGYWDGVLDETRRELGAAAVAAAVAAAARHGEEQGKSQHQEDLQHQRGNQQAVTVVTTALAVMAVGEKKGQEEEEEEKEQCTVCFDIIDKQRRR